MDDSQFFQDLVERFRVNVQCQAASLYILDSSGSRLELRAASGYNEPLLRKGVTYNLGQGLTGWIAIHGASFRANSRNELRSHMGWQGRFDQDQWGQTGADTFLGIPLKTREGKVVGVFKAENKLGDNPVFSDVDVTIAQSIADLATMAITLRQEKADLGKFIYAFVLMPFDARFDDIYNYGIKRTITELGITCERVGGTQFVGGILEQVFKSIEKARFIIADMTGRNPNVFYEVGYCHALKKEVILCTQSVDDIPFDLRGFNHIVYQGKISLLEKELRKRALSLLQEDEKVTKMEE